MYRRLIPEKIIETLERLQVRIDERFPGSGLSQVGAELTAIARVSHARTERLARPNWGLRTLSVLVVAAGIGVAFYLTRLVRELPANLEIFGLMQGVDAAVHLAIVIGAGVLFLTTLEGRLKRRAALAHLHELRAIVHVIDMHQLTKDPSALVTIGTSTPASPKRILRSYELTRYLDYCSELLSLTAKVAALYAQASSDTQVIETVNDLERLIANLSQKVWQKIAILDRRSTAAEQGQEAGAQSLSPAAGR
ncbi:MAG: hypothetical protein ACREC6_09865 [Hyphomicrobiaceae bacterium]